MITVNMKDRLKFRFDVAWKGLAMGIAEIIPGVSGGTIAFVTGIYSELMDTIKSFDVSFFKMLLQGKWKEAFKMLNLSFMLSLGSGMGAGIVFGVFAISHLLTHYPEPVWGFFFGLIGASALYIARESKFKDIFAFIALFLGFAIAFWISFIAPSEGNQDYWFIYVSGIIAISAMLLPGISGSFMLVLLGMYSYILGNVKNLLTHPDWISIGVIFVFVLGLITGAATFSRVFSWLFTKNKNITLALLTGFLIGSLPKIWPWKNVDLIYDKEGQKLVSITNFESLQQFDKSSIKIVSENLVWPSDYWDTPRLWVTVLACVLGFCLVFVFEYRKKA